MWDAIAWWRTIENADVARTVDELRRDALRLFVGGTAAGYLLWHFVRSQESSMQGLPGESSLSHWLTFPLAALSLGGTWTLQQHRPQIAAWYFVTSSTLFLTAAAWLLGAPSVTMLYPLLTLAAVVLLHPLAGLAISAASITLLSILRQAGPLDWLSLDRLTETGVACLLTVAAAWALGRNLVVAVEWSSKSYAEAWRNAQEARSNRAELMQALKQLDHAYYALRRANAALELAWKAADAAEQSKTEFVTNISHELRTPLNLIIGFSEMILTSPETYRIPLPPAYRGDLNAIYRSAQHLLTLTNDVIDLARVGIGRLALLREPVDLAQVIADACAIIQMYIEAKGLRLRIDVQPSLPLLHLDHLRIRQVVLNLLTNAARFTEQGGITISAAAENDAVLVQVADTGPGIAPEDLPKVFDEFYSTGRHSDHGSRSLGGVGLGLPLSRRLVELHGGRIGVESRPGAGTTFWFRLPTGVAPAAAQSERWPERRDSSRTSIEERMLVLAEADTQVVELFQRHLSGYRIIGAPDFQSAVAAAGEVRALAVLTDPATAVDHAVYQDVPVPVFVLPLPQSNRIASSLGATACLTKPVTRAKLHAAIAHLERPIHSILLIDDDPRFLRLLERILQATPHQPDYVIRRAHNGREALTMMGMEQPDLVLLDLVMPDMGGSETLAAMHASPTLAAVPVIIISAQDQIQAQLPLKGPFSIVKHDGFQLEEILGAVEGLLSVLRPPRPYPATPTSIGGGEDSIVPVNGAELMR